jgi:UDPglucose 6-dehydrogenase
MKRSIGIIGIGVVGTAVAEYYKAQGDQPVFLYDKFKKVGDFDAAANADYVFLCLPTPTRDDGTQDIFALEEVVGALPQGKTVIIKSTVLPGTTDRFQNERPDLMLFHNPEFLDAKTAVHDFAVPDMEVLGATDRSRDHAAEVMAILPRAPHEAVCRADESEMVKYFMNSFMAVKNSFANQMYDYCVAKKIDYEAVKDVVKFAPRMGGEVHLKVLMDGYRGFGGACLPKDTAALVADAVANGAPLELLSLVRKLNEGYTHEHVS